MKSHLDENILISYRSIKDRLSESLLLIIGIALGVGAAAAGIALIINSRITAEEQLQLPAYREIIVSVREEASHMETPVQEIGSSDSVELNAVDIEAAEELPSVDYGYIAQDTEWRLGDFERMMGERNDGGQEPPDAPDSGNSENFSEETPTENQEFSEEERMQPPQEMEMISQEEIESPEPLLDEIWGMEVSPQFFSAWNLEADQGSLISEADMDYQNPVLVLGSKLAQELFEDGQALGREVLSMNRIYTIIGILEESGTDVDGQAFSNVNTGSSQFQFPRMGMSGTDMELIFSVQNAEDLSMAAYQLSSWFEAEYGENNISLSIPREEVEAAQDRNSRLVVIILFLSLAGLLIAVVNVSNILMGRALRKTRSVGIMKALGASKADIFGQFTIEALILSIIGSCFGILLSFGLSGIMEATLSTQSIQPLFLILGALIGFIITLSFTVIPAYQATKINPAEAVKSE